MGCSDTWAEALESRDPAFRERNEHNSRARNLERSHGLVLCQCGKDAFEGNLVHVPILERITRPQGNQYLDADAGVSAELGTWRTESQEVSINRAADAADSLRGWMLTGRGGALAFDWLIGHWARDLDTLARKNARHTDELKRLPPASPKAVKRRALLAVDVPALDEIRRRIIWAEQKRVACK